MCSPHLNTPESEEIKHLGWFKMWQNLYFDKNMWPGHVCKIKLSLSFFLLTSSSIINIIIKTIIIIIIVIIIITRKMCRILRPSPPTLCWSRPWLPATRWSRLSLKPYQSFIWLTDLTISVLVERGTDRLPHGHQAVWGNQMGERDYDQKSMIMIKWARTTRVWCTANLFSTLCLYHHFTAVRCWSLLWLLLWSLLSNKFKSVWSYSSSSHSKSKWTSFNQYMPQVL